MGEPEAHQQEQPGNGDVLASISGRIVSLHKEFYGKGPTKAKTYYSGDVITVLLRGGFTKAEETLRAAGRGGDVIEQRVAFQEVMRSRYVEAIEEVTGRRVAAFMSGSHQDPDLVAEIFVLEPNEITAEEQAEAAANVEEWKAGGRGGAGAGA